MFQLQSSNPALTNKDAFSEVYGKNMFAAEKSNVTTLSGVVNKTGILVAIAVAGGALGYWLVATMPSIVFISSIAGFVLCLGFGWLLCGKPQLSPVVAPIYAIVEGIFLGSLTGMLDQFLVKAGPAGAATGPTLSLGLQAFILTISIVLGMLGLYYTGLLKPTKVFMSVVKVATAGVMMAYTVSFVLMLVGLGGLPFLSLGSALQGGTPALIGLGLNVAILGLASLWLIIDFKMVEENVAAGAPKYMEWYLGFALLVTLAWIYYEAVKLAFRLALLFGDRD